MKFDFLKKLASMGEAAATERYGDAFGKAGKIGKLGMRIAAGDEYGSASPFEFAPGSPGGEMDLERFVSLRPKMPDGMNPRQMYGNLYSSYGGRKMRGLLFD